MMAKKGKLKIHKETIKQLMKSEEIQQACLKEAQAIKNSAGDGYRVDTFLGETRVNCSVTPYTPDAIKDTLQNNTLIKLADSQKK